MKNRRLAQVPAYSDPPPDPTPPPPTIWDPSQASVPLLAWYFPSYATADLIDGLTHVTRLYDQSGNGDPNRDQISFGTPHPNYNNADADYGGKPSVSGATDTALASAGAWSVAPAPPITIIAVGKATPTTAYLSGRNAAGNLLWQSGNNAQFYNGPALNAGLQNGTPAVIMVEDDGAAARIFVDDLSTPQAAAASLVSPDTGYSLLAGDAGILPINGSLAEVIFFGGILTPTDKANLVTYLNATRAYGIPVT